MSNAATVEPEAPAFPRLRGVGSDGFVNIDLTCKTCGRDLRGLSVDAKCPACGTEVVRSLRGEQIGSADPRWLKELANGGQWIAWTWLTQAVFTVTLTFSADEVYRPIGAIQLLAVLPWLFGVWRLSRPDPTGRGETEYGAWRRAWFISAIGVATLEIVHASSLLQASAASLVEPLWAFRCVGCAAASFIGFRYLAKFATRLSGFWVQLRAAFLGCSLPLCYLALACWILWDSPLGISWALLGGLLYVVSQLIAFRLLTTLGSHFRFDPTESEGDANQ